MRLRSAGYDLALESLERRQVMSVTAVPSVDSGPQPAEITVSPGDGQVYSIDSAPRQIVVTVARTALAGMPLGTWWNLVAPIRLDQVGPDGAISTIYNPNSGAAASIDNAAGTATIPLASPLQPGRYRIVLVGGTPLSQRLAGSPTESTQDQTLAEFEVVGKTTTLSDAVDLGSIGSSLATIPGALNLRAGNVALYKVTLGSNQPLWRLNLQVNAQSIGSPLRSALTLFDQQGRAIATRDAGTGLGAAIDDPYLFEALAPGVYYVGVSGAGNLGGQPGGYDPTTGAAGFSSTSKDVGPFQLLVSADPLTSPTRVVGFSLDQDDPATTIPTGFTITFSQAIDPQSLHGNSLYVQNQQGQTFPVILNSVGSGFSQVGFLFDRLLAPGEYRLVVPQSGGLTDLVGRTPSNGGLPTGTLAVWTVDASQASSGGTAPIAATLTESADGARLSSEGDGVLASGGQITIRLVVPPVNGALLYLTASTSNLQLAKLSGNAIVINGTPIDINEISGVDGLPYGYRFALNLTKGVNLLRLTATGADGLTFAWKLSMDFMDSFITNAVGSAGAIGLRMVETSPTDAVVGTVGTPSIVSTAAAPGPGPGPGSVVLGKLPSTFTVTVGSALVGRPSIANDPIAALGSGAPGGLVAMSGQGRGPAVGSFLASSQGDDGRPRDPEGLIESGEAVGGEVGRAEPTARAEPSRPAAVEPSSDEADVLALLEAERRTAAARRFAWWLFGDDEDAPNVVATADRLNPAAREAADAAAAEHRREVRADLETSGKVERAALGAPFGLIVAAAAAFRFRQAARRLWRRPGAGSAAPTSRSAQPPLFRGPRYMTPPSVRASRSRSRARV